MCMEEKLKVSVIVPVYNASTTIDRCVKSIIEQDYRNIECILIENCSSDTSADICKKYSEGYKQIKVGFCGKKGASEARNMGLSMATGDIIGFCDADDIIEKGALKTVVTEFMNDANIIGVFGALFSEMKGADGMHIQYQGISRRCVPVQRAQELMLGTERVMGSVCNKYYRAQIVKGVLFDTSLSYCEDMHFNAKVLSRFLNDSKIMVIDTPVYSYLMNSQSVTYQSNAFFDEFGNLKYIIALKKILKECRIKRTSKAIIRMRIAGFAIDYFERTGVTENQKKLLLKELRKNYFYLLFHLLRFYFYFDFRANCKKAVKGMKVIIKYRRMLLGKG